MAEGSAEMVKNFILKAVAESKKNRLQLIDNSPIFEEPLVAFAAGHDPIFSQYKTIIGQFHRTRALPPLTPPTAPSWSMVPVASALIAVPPRLSPLKDMTRRGALIACTAPSSSSRSGTG